MLILFYFRFPEMCNSQQGKISEENASTLEERLVHTVYEKIASHFHDTRHTPWPRVKKFIESVEEGGLILDIGCGNGKYFHLNKNIIQVISC
jgi:alkylated DNA repair protein alkB family protein 8